MDAIKILVVDDEARMRKLVKDFLVKDGFEAVALNDHNEIITKYLRRIYLIYRIFRTYSKRNRIYGMIVNTSMSNVYF